MDAGIEGSIWTMQKIAGLSPLAGFGFEALFLTSVKLEDKDLTPLAGCPNLKHLACARFARVELQCIHINTRIAVNGADPHLIQDVLQNCHALG